MSSPAFLHFAPLALIALATAAPAQFVTVQPGQPTNMTVPPGPVGVPGGRMDSTAMPGDVSMPTTIDQHKDIPKSRDAARPAKAGELSIGATIADNKGAEVGYIKSIDTDGVVVATAAGQVKVPADALGKNKKGLLIGMSKADFDKLVAQAMGG